MHTANREEARGGGGREGGGGGGGGIPAEFLALLNFFVYRIHENDCYDALRIRAPFSVQRKIDFSVGSIDVQLY